MALSDRRDPRGDLIRCKMLARQDQMPHRIACPLAGLIAAASAFAQVRTPGEFEVASVRPNTSDDRIVTINVGPGGRFTAKGYTLVLLIQRAYGVMDWNVTGGPGWIRSERFDVAAEANVGGNLTEAQLQPMLQALLAERIKAAGAPVLEGDAGLCARGGSRRSESNGCKGW